MKILIDTSPLSSAHAIRGIGRYTRELVGAMRKLETSDEIYTTEDNYQGDVDLVYYPYFDLFFPTLPLIKKAKTVVMIHDVIPLVFSSHYPVGIKGTLNFWRQRLALQNIAAVITNSQCSARDIHEFLRIPSESIHPILLAAGEEFVPAKQAAVHAARKKYQLPKQYALYVGDMNYNKNLPFLIRCAQKVPKLHLVMVGSQLDNTSIPEGQILHEAIAFANIADRVHILTTVGSEDLSAIYTDALFYIQPSLYEGFGFPVLEAMQCHVPVISSCGGGLPEVVGDAAIQFHPRDEEDCVRAMQTVLHLTKEQRQRQIQKGIEQAEKFTWEKTASETLAIFMAIAKN